MTLTDPALVPPESQVLRAPYGLLFLYHRSIANNDAACQLIAPGSVNVPGVNRCESTFSMNAFERPDDGVGNDNGLCRSDETCVFMPNVDAFQAHGALIPAGTIEAGGTVENVRRTLANLVEQRLRRGGPAAVVTSLERVGREHPSAAHLMLPRWSGCSRRRSRRRPSTTLRNRPEGSRAADDSHASSPSGPTASFSRRSCRFSERTDTSK